LESEQSSLPHEDEFLSVDPHHLSQKYTELQTRKTGFQTFSNAIGQQAA